MALDLDRNLDTTSTTESKKDNIRVLHLLWLDLDAGDAFYNSSNQNFSFDIASLDPAALEPAGTNNYIGVGNIGSIDTISEVDDIQGSAISIKLSGIPSSHISMALAETYHARKITIRLAILDENYTIINTPVLIFSGMIDNMELEVESDATIIIKADSKFADWERPRLSRWNSQEQQANRDPTDLGFDHVAELIDKEILWGPQTISKEN